MENNIVAVYIFDDKEIKSAAVKEGEKAVEATLLGPDAILKNMEKKITCEKTYLKTYEEKGYSVVSIDECDTVHSKGEIIQRLYILVR